MKKIVLFLAAIWCSILSISQSKIVVADVVDAKKIIYVPRVSTLPAVKAGLLVYKVSGLDSGLYIGSTTGVAWNKLFPSSGSGGTTYVIGNGLKQVGTTLRWADSLFANTTINSNNFSLYFEGDADKRFGTGRYGATAYRGVLTNSTTTSLIASGSNTSINGAFVASEGSATIRARNSTLAVPTRQVIFTVNTDSIKITAETASGMQGYQMRANSNAGKYLFLTIDSTSGGLVAVRGIDTVVNPSKEYVNNKIAAATLSSIPGIIDVQDVQDGGLRATNWRNQVYHDSSYLTVDKGNELYGGISSESRNKVVGEHWEFISAPASTTGGGNDLAIVGVGSGAVAGMASTPSPNRPGILVLQTGSTATGRCTIYNHSTMSMLMLGGGEFVTEFEVRHPTLYSSGEQYLTQFGLLSSISIDQNNAVYVVYDEGGQTSPGPGSANYKFITAAGNVRTVTTTTVPVVAGTTSEFQRLRIEVTAAADTARLYINGTLAATHTTNIPTNAAMTLMGNIMKYGTGTTSRTVQFDYINWRYKFTTTR